MITNEIKAKVLAQYLGEKFKVHNSKQTFVCRGNTIELIFEDKMPWPSATLILKPLSDIKDDDAIEIAKICERKDYSTGEYRAGGGKDIIRNIDKEAGLKYHVSPQQIALSIQYLISKGYDLPNYLLGGKTLKESGLAIYE